MPRRGGVLGGDGRGLGQQPLPGLLGVRSGGQQRELGGELGIGGQQGERGAALLAGLEHTDRARGDGGGGVRAQRARGEDRGARARLLHGLERLGVDVGPLDPQRLAVRLEPSLLPGLLAARPHHVVEPFGAGGAQAHGVGLGVGHAQHGAARRGLLEGVGELGGQRRGLVLEHGPQRVLLLVLGAAAGSVHLGADGHLGRVQQRGVQPPVHVLALRELLDRGEAAGGDGLLVGGGVGDHGRGVLGGQRQHHGLGDRRVGPVGTPHHEAAQRGQRLLLGDHGQRDPPGAPEVRLLGVAQLLRVQAHGQHGRLPGRELRVLGRARERRPGGVRGGLGLPVGEQAAIGHARGAGAQLEGERIERLGGGVGHVDLRLESAVGREGGGGEGDQIHAHRRVLARIRRCGGGGMGR